ncbi:MAG TPA: hypothetical protein PKO06_11415, partial [Candidatus Ozemobacteraceae bacterium]|nr:hypothetical protein [Candidatus Ozemobacteraceae bacterium]
AELAVDPGQSSAKLRLLDDRPRKIQVQAMLPGGDTLAAEGEVLLQAQAVQVEVTAQSPSVPRPKLWNGEVMVELGTDIAVGEKIPVQAVVTPELPDQKLRYLWRADVGTRILEQKGDRVVVTRAETGEGTISVDVQSETGAFLGTGEIRFCVAVDSDLLQATDSQKAAAARAALAEKFWKQGLGREAQEHLQQAINAGGSVENLQRLYDQRAGIIAELDGLLTVAETQIESDVKAAEDSLRQATARYPASVGIERLREKIRRHRLTVEGQARELLEEVVRLLDQGRFQEALDVLTTLQPNRPLLPEAVQENMKSLEERAQKGLLNQVALVAKLAELSSNVDVSDPEALYRELSDLEKCVIASPSIIADSGMRQLNDALRQVGEKRARLSAHRETLTGITAAVHAGHVRGELIDEGLRVADEILAILPQDAPTLVARETLSKARGD